MPTYNTLSEAVNDLTKRGYTEDFRIKRDCLYCTGLQISLQPEEFKIDEFYRFEGMSNPDDNSIVYAISSNDGKVKGTLTDAYGVYADGLTPAMAERLKFRTE